ncbi:hypothetical protein HAX54_002806 [Datura stramonium]|uniref:Uncharacterized protein n=1 Tax=Datura stramonium TaxID=4076 RepID=A0ABS8T559_DATST|nr:hypothetical protein [Datura stramonium]
MTLNFRSMRRNLVSLQFLQKLNIRWMFQLKDRGAWYACMVSSLLSKDENLVDILKDSAQLCYFLQRNLVTSHRQVEVETVTTTKGPSRDFAKVFKGNLSHPSDNRWKQRPVVSGGVGVQSTISKLIDAQQCATEEVDYLSVLVAQKEVEMTLLKATQTSKKTVGEPGVVLDLQCENAQLKVEYTALKKQLEELMHQILQDQHASNERIDKLLSKLYSVFPPASFPFSCPFLSLVPPNSFHPCYFPLSPVCNNVGELASCDNHIDENLVHEFIIIKKGEIDEA